MGTATKATRTRMYDIIHEETGWPYIKIQTSIKTIKKKPTIVGFIKKILFSFISIYNGMYFTFIVY
jgi:hypothetical protein